MKIRKPSIIGRKRQAHIEPLEVRQMLSAAVSSTPLAPPAGSTKLTGAVIGTAGSYQNQGNTIANVFDGNGNTFFDAPAGVQGWAGLNLGTPELITQVQYVPRASFASRMVGGIFQGSNTADFSSGVINLFTVTATPASQMYTAQTVTDTVTVQYVRYLAPLYGSGNVAELEFDGTSAVIPPNPVAPDAPSMTATAVSSSDVHITFAEDAASSAVSTYTIEREGPNDSNYVAIGSAAGSATSFEDTTVVASTIYSYEVTASNNAGVSLPSSAISVSVPAAHVAPTGGSKLTGAVIGTSGSYGNQGNTIANAFDGNPNTYFDAPSSSGGWAGLNLGSPAIVSQVQYIPRVGWAGRMVGGTFQGSNVANFSSGVINLFTVTATPATGIFTVQAVTDTVGVQYVRYIGPNGGYGNVAEIEFDGAPVALPPSPDAPTITMSSAVSATDVHLAWTEDAASSAVATYTIERQGPNDASFIVIGTAAGTTTFDDANVSPSTTYSYEVLATNAGGISLPSNSVAITLPAAPANPWTDTDIGGPALAGSASLNSNGTINVTGGGADIWNQTDAFNFDYQPMVGNGTIIAQVTGQTNSNGWAKSGVMVRETADADSRFVDLVITPGNGLTMQARTATHVTPTYSVNISGKLGLWLELIRNGGSFSGYYSSNGVNWTLVGTVNITMVNNIDAGLCVTSHDNTRISTGAFSNVSITTTGAQASAWSDGATAPLDRWESESFSYNGELYTFGGYIDRTLDATAECDAYNPATNSWSYVTTIPIGALTHGSVSVVGDVVYIAGGNIGNFSSYTNAVTTADVLTYNLKTHVWGSVAPLPAAVTCGGLVTVNNQLIYYGGINANSSADLSNTWSLDLTNPNASWTAKAPMPNARNHIGYEVINGIAYAVGGQHLYQSTTGNVSEVDAYNPVTDVWTKVASLPTVLGAIHTSTMAVNGKIVVLGGQINGGYDGIYQSNIEEYDPTTNSWTSVGTLPEANEGESIAYVNGELIVADGTVDNQGGWSQDQTWLDSEITL